VPATETQILEVRMQGSLRVASSQRTVEQDTGLVAMLVTF